MNNVVKRTLTTLSGHRISCILAFQDYDEVQEWPHCMPDNLSLKDAREWEAYLVWPKGCERWRVKRQNEYRAGRYAAIQAMKKAGFEPAPVISLSNRSPKWPEGLKGSITHSDGLAACLLFDNEGGKITGLGVDIESLDSVAKNLPEPDLVLTGEEIALIEESVLTMVQGISLVFSSKESVFKAVFPQYGRYFDFLDATLSGISVSSVEQEALTGSLVLTLNKTLMEDLPAGKAFLVEFEFLQGRVLTTACY